LPLARPGPLAEPAVEGCCGIKGVLALGVHTAGHQQHCKRCQHLCILRFHIGLHVMLRNGEAASAAARVTRQSRFLFPGSHSMLAQQAFPLYKLHKKPVETPMLRPQTLLFPFLLAQSLFLSSALSAAEPDYVTIAMQIDIDRPAADAWASFGGYCDISEWAELVCEMTEGDGGIGSVRVLDNGRVSEILVAQTELSYGYTQPPLPGQFYNLYHGFMEVRPLTASTSRLLYTLMLDASSMDEAARAEDLARRRTRFEGFLQNMKRIAEAR